MLEATIDKYDTEAASNKIFGFCMGSLTFAACVKLTGKFVSLTN